MHEAADECDAVSVAGTHVSGYAHPAYARALEEFGEPRSLDRCGGYLLERPVPGGGRDAAGCYPLFSCERWGGLGEDLAALEGELVSVVMVVDPFGEPTADELREWFPDHVVAFKQHFVVDLTRWEPAAVARHHRRNTRRGLARVAVEQVGEPTAGLAEWNELYAGLIRRHNVEGVAAFSPESFARQFRVPGLVVFRATAADETVGMCLWYVSRGVAYWHLSAYRERGYELDASYALMWFAIQHFASTGERWLELGGNAGSGMDADSGLSFFKRGWSTETRWAYLCGRILDRRRYAEAGRSSGGGGTAYFPAYRGNMVDD
jgi:hypothetical protein